MKRFAKKIGYGLAGLLLLMTSCVRSGADDCGGYLRIVYDYNMDYKDLFEKQVTFLSVFAFDAETGVLVSEIKKQQNPFPENYKMEIPMELQGRKLTLVVWAGLDPDSYQFPMMTPGTSTMNDLKVRVRGCETFCVNRSEALCPLWHGILENIEFSPMDTEVKTVSMMKNTNKFRVILQTFNDIDNGALDINNFDVRIFSANGKYNCHNALEDNKLQQIEYTTYYEANDPEVGAIAELNTLRLMNDGRANIFRLTDNRSGKDILNLNLTKYIDALKLLQWNSIPLQEYMDREDRYSILVLLERANPDDPRSGWMSAQVRINDWVIRVTDVDD